MSVILILSSCKSQEEEIFNKALDLQNQQKYENAIELYNKIINEFPSGKFVTNSNVKLNQCIDSLVRMADDYNQKKDYFKAVFYYEKALEFRNNDVDIKTKNENVKKILSNNNQTKTNEANPDEIKKLKEAIKELKIYKDKKFNTITSINSSQIIGLLKSWQNSWQNLNIDEYSLYYDHDNFVGFSNGQIVNYDEWIKYKRNLFSIYSGVKIDTSINHFKIEGDQLKIYFTQWFSVSNPNPYSDVTNKEIIFKYNDSKGWLIISEKPYN